MSENNGPIDPGLAAAVQQEPVIQVLITYKPNSNEIGVQSPVFGNRLLMYGLLEAAKQLVATHQPEEERRIVPVSFGGIPRN